MVFPKRLGNRFSTADFELSDASPMTTAILHRRNLLVLILAVCVTSWAADKPTADSRADRIVIVKSTYTLTLMNHGQVLKTYKVALGGVADRSSITRALGALRKKTKDCRS
jgi:hypothetical protein